MFKSRIMGRLVGDPESKTVQTKNGEKTLTIFRVATSNYPDETSFVDVVAWDRNGEIILQNLKKGSQILFDANNKVRKYEDKDKNVRYTTEYKLTEFWFIGGDGKKADAEEVVTAATADEVSPF